MKKRGEKILEKEKVGYRQLKPWPSSVLLAEKQHWRGEAGRFWAKGMHVGVGDIVLQELFRKSPGALRKVALTWGNG